jgi:hypothetical protein
MCAGPFRPKRTVIQPDPKIAEEQKAAADRATEDARSTRDDRLKEKLTLIGGKGRGGRGRRSLLTSSRGGMGYFNEYLD